MYTRLTQGRLEIYLNLDATAFELGAISDRTNTANVWVTKETKQQFDNSSSGLQTRKTGDHDTGVFAKHLTLVNGSGRSAPFVFILANSSLEKGEFVCEPVQDLGTDRNPKGYIVVAHSRNPSAEFYKWYYNEILLPFVQSLRKAYRYGVDGKNVECPFALWIDGEHNQLKPLLDTEMNKAMHEKGVHVFKGPGSTTNITQMLDTSPIFKNAHAKMKSESCQLMYEDSPDLRYRVLEVIQRHIQCAKKKRDSYAELIIRSTFALRSAVTEPAIRNGMKKTGCFVSDKSNRPYYDDEIIMRNFKIAGVDVAGLSSWNDAAQALLRNFVKYGSLTDAELKKHECVEKLLDEKGNKPRDERTITQQRCVIVTSKLLLNKVLKAKADKLPKPKDSKQTTVPEVTVKTKTVTGKRKLGNTTGTGKEKLRKKRCIPEDIYEKFYVNKKNTKRGQM